MLLNYVEENRFRAGDRMVLREGHFNDLLLRLPVQPNGHRKTAKNCHDKWESLKREYYAASAVAGGSGQAYSAGKGADVVTEAGQLVMDDLVENRPDVAQFRNTGFKYLDRMQEFVPPDKARGTNAHHATGARPPAQMSQVSASKPPTTIKQPIISPQPALAWPPVQYHPSPAPSLAQLTFVQYQPESLDQTQITQMRRNMEPTADTPATPAAPLIAPSVFVPTVSPSSIPMSPPSSAMVSTTSVNPSSSMSSRGRKRKSDATTELEPTSTTSSSVAGSSGSRKRRSQVATVADAMQEIKGFMTNMQETSDTALSKALATLEPASKSRDLDEVCRMIYQLEKNLSLENQMRLQMIFEEHPTYIAGYRNAAAVSATRRMVWVKMRLEAVGFQVPEYACVVRNT
ncbi:hypothetical protein M404DRAFT_35105 [Pisolithus tinctorius Marx 270]|uniref:Myb/SANT-like domain-containing protein n=1 Tax=Pisolithus tinctorius Marx 270 TaxID=870435 RepID=A0A0C3IBF5_PISTI|nr:hypothetical protein M404DRAFT_35105 [Pisolithus tinctorius Marx 270]